jgi:hypothetical protein
VSDPALPLAEVRRTTAAVVAAARHVAIVDDAVADLATRLAAEPTPGQPWDTAIHFADDGPLTAHYVLVLDALNFCFWPDPAWSYRRLARTLTHVLREDPAFFAAHRLAELSAGNLRRWLDEDMPLADERVRLLRELGQVLVSRFRGEATALVAAAGGSAERLVSLLAAELPGFRDHAVYRGRQVFLYKRAQILVADLWGAYRGQGLGAFADIERLTAFADYRLPQLLRELGAVRYEPGLAARIDAMQLLAAGSAEEIEIRAATVQAVERLRDAMAARGQPLAAVELDGRLWHEAQARRERLRPHHRVLTIYY